MNTFKFIGQIKKIEDKGERKAIEDKTYDSGWTAKRVRFRMVCGETSMFLEASGGKWSNGKNQVYTYFTKEDEPNKSEKAQVDWNDRFNPEIIEKVPRYRRYTVDLSSDRLRKQFEELGNEAALQLANQKKFSYIAEYDFVGKIEELIVGGLFGDVNYVVSGNVEYSYSINKKGEPVYYQSYVPTSIYLASEDETPCALGKLDFFYDKDDYIDDALENGDIPVRGYVKYYDGMGKGNYYAPTTLFLKNKYERTEGLKKVLDMNTEDDNVVALEAIVSFYSASPKVEITADDLSEDEKQLIEWGVKTLEETIKERGGSMYESRITRTYIMGTGKGERAIPKSAGVTLEQLNEKPATRKGEKTTKGAAKPKIDLFDDEDEI